METMYRCCAGLDVHKETVEAQLRRMEADGKLWQQTRRWMTMTGQLEAMAEWLAGEGVTHVAMEWTGVYWKPIYNILQGRFTILLVNARHMKQVPGRKRDVKDCQWIAQFAAARAVRREFCAAARTAGIAGTDAASDAVGGGEDADREPHSQDTGRREHQAGIGGQRHSGSMGASDAGCGDRWRDG